MRGGGVVGGGCRWSGHSAHVRRVVTDCRLAGPQSTVRDLSTVPARRVVTGDGRKERVGAAAGLRSGARARSGHPAHVRRVVTDCRVAGPQSTVRDRSTVPARRVVTGDGRKERVGAAARLRSGARARSGHPAHVRRVVSSRRLAGPQSTVRDLSTVPARRVVTSDGREARVGAAAGLRSGACGRSGHPAHVRRVVKDCRLAGPQSTSRDRSTVPARRVVTGPRTGGAGRCRHAPPVRRVRAVRAPRSRPPSGHGLSVGGAAVDEP